jgi:hypothetical protein
LLIYTSNIRSKNENCIKDSSDSVTDKRKVVYMLDDALDVLIRDLSYSEALEYCADQIALTKILERIAEDFNVCP